MRRYQQNSNLSKWTEEELNAVLEAKVAMLNAAVQSPSSLSDKGFGLILSLEIDCKRIGNEIRTRHGRPLLP